MDAVIFLRSSAKLCTAVSNMSSSRSLHLVDGVEDEPWAESSLAVRSARSLKALPAEEKMADTREELEGGPDVILDETQVPSLGVELF